MQFVLLKTDLLKTYIDSPKVSIGFIIILLSISANTSVIAIEYLGSNLMASLYFLQSSSKIDI